MKNENKQYNKLVKAKYGHVLYNRFDQYIGRSIQMYGEYSDAEVELYRKILQPGDIVIEVGANIGVHTLPLARLVGDCGHVYAFEPQRLVFQTLCANMAINSVSNVTCYPCGLGAEQKIVEVVEYESEAPRNFGGVSIDEVVLAEGGHTQEVDRKVSKLQVDLLDNLLADVAVKLLKIDVEGMEQEVLKGAKKIITKHKPVVYIENDRQEKSKDLIELLWSMGYKLYWFLPSLYSSKNCYGNGNNIFGRIVSVNMICMIDGANLDVSDFSEVLDSNFHPMRKVINKTC